MIMGRGGFNRRQHRPMIVQAGHEPELSACIIFSRLAQSPHRLKNGQVAERKVDRVPAHDLALLTRP